MPAFGDDRFRLPAYGHLATRDFKGREDIGDIPGLPSGQKPWQIGDMSFRIEKRVGVRASSDRIWEILTDLSSWDHWNPIETRLEGTIAYGGTLSLTENIPGLPERRYTAAIGDWQPRAQLILQEKRGWQFTAIRYFEIDELEPESCIVANGIIFGGLRGEGFHDKKRKLLRPHYDRVAEALKAYAEA